MGSNDIKEGEDPVYGYVDMFKQVGDERPQHVYMLHTRKVKIGREHRCDIRLHSLRVSRLQCCVKITKNDGDRPRVFLQNLSSKATTKYNGGGIAQNAQVELNHGDRFQLHDIELRFRDYDPTCPTAQPDPGSGPRIPVIRLRSVDKSGTPEKSNDDRTPKTPKTDKPKSSRVSARSSGRMNKSLGSAAAGGELSVKRRKSSEIDMRKAVLKKTFRSSVQGIKFPQIAESLETSGSSSNSNGCEAKEEAVEEDDSMDFEENEEGGDDNVDGDEMAAPSNNIHADDTLVEAVEEDLIQLDSPSGVLDHDSPDKIETEGEDLFDDIEREMFVLHHGDTGEAPAEDEDTNVVTQEVDEDIANAETQELDTLVIETEAMPTTSLPVEKIVSVSDPDLFLLVQDTLANSNDTSNATPEEPCTEPEGISTQAGSVVDGDVSADPVVDDHLPTTSVVETPAKSVGRDSALFDGSMTMAKTFCTAFEGDDQGDVSLNTTAKTTNDEFFDAEQDDVGSSDDIFEHSSGSGNKSSTVEAVDLDSDVEILTQEEEMDINNQMTQQIVKSPSKSPAKLPLESPAKLPLESPAKSPMEGPAKSPRESPAKSPRESPAKSPKEGAAKSPRESPDRSRSKSLSKSPSKNPAGVTLVVEGSSLSKAVEKVKAVVVSTSCPETEGVSVPEFIDLDDSSSDNITGDKSDERLLTGTDPFNFPAIDSEEIIELDQESELLDVEESDACSLNPTTTPKVNSETAEISEDISSELNIENQTSPLDVDLDTQVVLLEDVADVEVGNAEKLVPASEVSYAESGAVTIQEPRTDALMGEPHNSPAVIEEQTTENTQNVEVTEPTAEPVEETQLISAQDEQERRDDGAVPTPKPNVKAPPTPKHNVKAPPTPKPSVKDTPEVTPARSLRPRRATTDSVNSDSAPVSTPRRGRSKNLEETPQSLLKRNAMTTPRRGAALARLQTSEPSQKVRSRAKSEEQTPRGTRSRALAIEDKIAESEEDVIIETNENKIIESEAEKVIESEIVATAGPISDTVHAGAPKSNEEVDLSEVVDVAGSMTKANEVASEAEPVCTDDKAVPTEHEKNESNYFVPICSSDIEDDLQSVVSVGREVQREVPKVVEVELPVRDAEKDKQEAEAMDLEDKENHNISENNEERTSEKEASKNKQRQVLVDSDLPKPCLRDCSVVLQRIIVHVDPCYSSDEEDLEPRTLPIEEAATLGNKSTVRSESVSLKSQIPSTLDVVLKSPEVVNVLRDSPTSAEKESELSDADNVQNAGLEAVSKDGTSSSEVKDVSISEVPCSEKEASLLVGFSPSGNAEERMEEDVNPEPVSSAAVSPEASLESPEKSIAATPPGTQARKSLRSSAAKTTPVTMSFRGRTGRKTSSAREELKQKSRRVSSQNSSTDGDDIAEVDVVHDEREESSEVDVAASPGDAEVSDAATPEKHIEADTAESDVEAEINDTDTAAPDVDEEIDETAGIVDDEEIDGVGISASDDDDEAPGGDEEEDSVGDAIPESSTEASVDKVVPSTPAPSEDRNLSLPSTSVRELPKKESLKSKPFASTPNQTESATATPGTIKNCSIILQRVNVSNDLSTPVTTRTTVRKDNALAKEVTPSADTSSRSVTRRKLRNKSPSPSPSPSAKQSHRNVGAESEEKSEEQPSRNRKAPKVMSTLKSTKKVMSKKVSESELSDNDQVPHSSASTVAEVSVGGKPSPKNDSTVSARRGRSRRMKAVELVELDADSDDGDVSQKTQSSTSDSDVQSRRNQGKSNSAKKGRRGRPKKATDDEVFVKPKSPVKKLRSGRLRSHEQDDTDSSSASSVRSTRSRRRPQADVVTIDDDDNDSGKEELQEENESRTLKTRTPRKNARKIQSSSENSDEGRENSSSEDAVVAEKSLAKPSEEVKEEEPHAKPKRGRGRAANAVVVEEEKVDPVVLPAAITKGRRGRKPGGIASDEEKVVESNVSEPESLQAPPKVEPSTSTDKLSAGTRKGRKKPQSDKLSKIDQKDSKPNVTDASEKTAEIASTSSKSKVQAHPEQSTIRIAHQMAGEPFVKIVPIDATATSGRATRQHKAVPETDVQVSAGSSRKQKRQKVDIPSPPKPRELPTEMKETKGRSRGGKKTQVVENVETSSSNSDLKTTRSTRGRKNEIDNVGDVDENESDHTKSKVPKATRGNTRSDVAKEDVITLADDSDEDNGSQSSSPQKKQSQASQNKPSSRNKRGRKIVVADSEHEENEEEDEPKPKRGRHNRQVEEPAVILDEPKSKKTRIGHKKTPVVPDIQTESEQEADEEEAKSSRNRRNVEDPKPAKNKTKAVGTKGGGRRHVKIPVPEDSDDEEEETVVSKVVNGNLKGRKNVELVKEEEVADTKKPKGRRRVPRAEEVLEPKAEQRDEVSDVDEEEESEDEEKLQSPPAKKAKGSNAQKKNQKNVAPTTSSGSTRSKRHQGAKKEALKDDESSDEQEHQPTKRGLKKNQGKKNIEVENENESESESEVPSVTPSKASSKGRGRRTRKEVQETKSKTAKSNSKNGSSPRVVLQLPVVAKKVEHEVVDLLSDDEDDAKPEKPTKRLRYTAKEVNKPVPTSKSIKSKTIRKRQI